MVKKLFKHEIKMNGKEFDTITYDGTECTHIKESNELSNDQFYGELIRIIKQNISVKITFEWEDESDKLPKIKDYLIHEIINEKYIKLKEEL